MKVPASEGRQSGAGVLQGRIEAQELELERARQELLESEARFSGLIASAPDAIIAVDQLQRIVLFNPAAGRMFRCDPGQTIGRPLNDFIPSKLRATHDAYVAGFARGDSSAGRMGPRNVAALRADGSEFPIEINISMETTSLGPVTTAYIRDVTERRQAEIALQTSEASLRRAQELAQMAHAIMDADGNVEHCSESFASLLGVPPDRVPNHMDAWMALIHAEDRERVRAALQEARRLRLRSDLEYRIRCGDGWNSIRHILEPLPESAGKAGGLRTFCILQDVTAQRRTEDKVRRLNRVYAVLGEINSLIVRAPDRDELFRQACRILVGTGRFAKAWIGMVDESVEPVRIMAWAGASDAFFEDLQCGLSARVAAAAKGMLGLALAGSQPVLSNDIAKDKRVLERDRLVASGSLSLALLPLSVEGKVIGVLSIHSATTGFFDEQETRLLLDLANDIAFALDHLMRADRMSYLANHDALTGLPNRVLLSDLIEQQIAEPERGELLSCVAMLDLVRFRRINETLGRRAGDELLMQVSSRLRDIDPFVARLGPDVFALQIIDRRSASELAREFEHVAARCFERPFAIAGEEIRIGCRIGAAVFPGDGGDAETLLRNAESALRRARAVPQPFVFYAPGMNATAMESLAVETKLRRAIERGEFVLHYQPKVRFLDRRICGVEALIRWQDPDQGLIPPMRFIPVLEESGLIGTVGKWALHRALDDLRRWRAAGAGPIRVAVNVSPLQLNLPNFPAQIAALVGDGDGDALELEITESVIMDDVDRKIIMLEEIRRLGVSIAVDDFGTGYSSLSYISRLPITSLKIDRAFVSAMTTGPDGYTLVSSIVALAHALKLKVVAEGVETEEQAHMLKLLHCDEAQGYLFSKAVPAERLLELLLSGQALP